MEVFLLKLLGLYFLIVGLVVIIRRRSVMPAVSEMVANKGLLFAMAAVEIVAGLALAIAYPSITWSLQGLLALIGYMMIIEGIVYLAAPMRFIQAVIRSFNRPWWYVSGGLVSVIVGIYLAGTGFGLF